MSTAKEILHHPRAWVYARGVSGSPALHERFDALHRSALREGYEIVGQSSDTRQRIAVWHPGRAALLRAVGNVDLVVPRGSRALIDFVRENARVPVIETGAGVCHAFLDTSADLKKARDIVLNAKTRRVSVCNALDCVLVHEGLCGKIGEIFAPLADSRVRIFADEKIRAALAGTYPAELLESAAEESFGTEFLDYKMSARVVPDLDAALAHIAAFGSKHSECVVAEDEEICGRFLAEVDAACVYANASTAFTDGGEFGFGAEVGISTQKLHARGPMGLPELTTYKYVVRGNGQIRA